MSDELRERCLRVIARGPRLRRPGEWRVAALLIAAALGCAPREPAPDRVLLVTIDTLRADRVGVYGAERAHTPTLDALAAAGVRFDAAISPAPLTLPSHATILTGLDPDRHGIRHNGVFTLAPEVPTIAERMRAAGWATAAFVGAFVLDARFGLARGFDVYDDDVGGRRSSRGAVSFSERRADAVVDAFLGWLGGAPERFFAWLHVYDPHAEYDPPAGFSLGFRHPYDGEIAFVDAQLARLFEALDARFPRERTLVVVTSDHGDALGEHGEPTHSYTIYEATQRVPLIVEGPGFRGGRVVSDVVRLADLAPTIAAAAGLDPLPESDGRDLRAVLGGGSAPEPAYSETLATHLDYGWSALFAVRDERWRYIAAPEPELYDLRADPRERRNVVSEHGEVAAERAAWLAARREREPIAAGAQQALSADERARLAALGYVSGTTARDDLSGPDPKERIRLLSDLSRAERLGGQGRWGDAYALLAASPETGPTFRAIRASYAVRAGRIDEAARDAEAGLAEAPEHGGLLRIAGFVREHHQQWAEARSWYERALRVDPADVAALNALGRIAEAEGDREQAERLYREALAAQPGAADPTWRLAALRFEQGDPDSARALLAEAAPPTDAATALRVTALEFDAGHRRDAASRLEAALDELELAIELTLPAAALLEAGGRGAAATRLHEAALRAAPDDWRFQNGAAWGLAQERRELDRALELAEAAVQGSGREPAVVDTLASVHLARGEYDDALRLAEEALRRAPAELRSHLYYVRASALSALGKQPQALDAARSAIDAGISPGSSWERAARALAGEPDADTLPPGSPP